MDIDGSGKLSFSEFARALRGLGVDLSNADLKAVFAVFDRSSPGEKGHGDGSISLIEFITTITAEPSGGAESRFYRYGSDRDPGPGHPSNHRLRVEGVSGGEGWGMASSHLPTPHNNSPPTVPRAGTALGRRCCRATSTPRTAG